MRNRVVLACVGCGCVAAIVVAGLQHGIDHALAAGGAAAIVEILNLVYQRAKK